MSKTAQIELTHDENLFLNAATGVAFGITTGDRMLAATSLQDFASAVAKMGPDGGRVFLDKMEAHLEATAPDLVIADEAVEVPAVAEVVASTEEAV